MKDEPSVTGTAALSADREEGILVSRSMTVSAPISTVFEVFVAKQAGWWPLASHHIGSAVPDDVLVEPRVGGRWFERSADGSECDWGRVVAWEPPRRVVLTWDITADWQHDPGLGTEVEVRFTPLDEATTRVDLEHRLLERYGEAAPMMKGIFESEGGWPGILERLARAAEGRVPRS